MSDGKLLVWFNQQMKALEQKPKNQTEMDTLRLLRDGLAKEAKEKGTRRRRKRLSSRSKS